MIRHEEGLWSLLRTDKNIRYLLKSFRHEKAPATTADAEHFEKVYQDLDQVTLDSKNSSSRQVKLVAVGDLMWIRSGWNRFLSKNVLDRISDRDLRICNLETPICADRPVKKYTYETAYYNAPAEYLAPWKHPSARTVFSICNNHALDQKLDGIAKTRSAILSQSEFSCVGGPETTDSNCLVEISGIKVGVMGITYGINHSRFGSPNGIPKSLFGSEMREPDWNRIFRSIVELKARGAELLVLSAHWGFEYEYYPEELQRKHAYRLIEMGIDLILGHSPHVLQPLELISVDGWRPNLATQVRRGGKARPAVIAYSLGNFASVMPTLACRTGALLNLDFEIDSDRNLKLTKIDAIPTVSQVGSENSWLDLKVMSTKELAATEQETAHRAHSHATMIFGSRLVDSIQKGPSDE